MATEKQLLGRIIHKHDIETNWDKATGFIPKQGEIIVYDIDDNYNYERFKIGDGKTSILNLPFYLEHEINNPDWNKLINKPFIKIGGDTLTWDGNTEGLISVADMYYKISDAVPTKADCANGIEYDGAVVDGETVQGAFADDGLLLGDGILFIPSDNYTLEGVTIPEAGVYFIKAEENYIHYLTIPNYTGFVKEQIDIKVLPEGYPYEEVNVTDISGQEYEITALDTRELPHGFNIPFELGQVWDVSHDTASSGDINTYSGLEVQQTDDGILYLGDINKSSVPFYITTDKISSHSGWLRMISPSYLKLVCVSGGVSETVVHTIDEKYLPDSVKTQADWNQNDETASDYIKNRPFGIGIVEILSETTIEVTSTELPIATEIELLEGSTYTVHWNGTEYTCIAQKWEMDGATAGIVVGDLSAVTTGEPTTGEPFIIADLSAEIAADVGAPTLLGALDGSTFVTVSIKEKIVKKIDNKYLEPFEIINETEIIEIFPETELTFEWNVDGSYNELSSALSLIPGNTYTIICDGVEYNSVCRTAIIGNSNITWVGNLVDVMGGDIAEITGSTSTEEPFVIINNSFEGAPITTQIRFIPDAFKTENENHTFTIYLNKDKDTTRIKTECLPEPLQFGSEITEILPETIIEQSEFPATLPLVADNTYTVKFNGVEYNCVCRTYEAEGILGYILGNFDAATGEGDTGEPFVLIYVPSFGACMIEVLDESITSVILSITGEVITKLDNKYLDLEWTPSRKPTTRVEVFPETTVNTTGDTIPLTEEFIASTEDKASYIVTWNGTEYTCNAMLLSNQFAIGNLYMINPDLAPNTGEPFLFFTTGQNLIISYTDEGSATFKIDRGYYDTLPYEFAPANYTITTDIPANQHANNDGQLSQAEYVLKHGGKVFATVDGRDVEILSMIADTVDNYHNFSWRDRLNGNIYTMPGSETDWKAQTPAVDRIDILLRHAHSGFDDVGYDDGTPPQKFRFTVDENGNLMSSNEDGTNQKKYLTESDGSGLNIPVTSADNGKFLRVVDGAWAASIPEEYITNESLNSKGYLTSIPEEYVTEEELTAKGYASVESPTFTGAFTHGSRQSGFAIGDNSFASGTNVRAIGVSSHAEGNYTTASGNYSHAEGNHTIASGTHSHAEGNHTIASGNYSHAEGYYTIASGQFSHAEGRSYSFSRSITGEANTLTYAVETTSQIETGNIINYNDIYALITAVDSDNNTITLDKTLSTEALDNVTATIMLGIAYANYSHVEGYNTIASGEFSHAEGSYTDATGESSHTEGWNTTASGSSSHAEGYNTTASGYYSHAEGQGTTASGNGQHVQGIYNIENSAYAHILGNGNNDSSKSNAHTIDWQGNAWFAGDVYVGSTSGTNKDAGSKKLATEEYIDIRVPAWTDSDEGKILRIVNGKPTWVSISNAEEVEF